MSRKFSDYKREINANKHYTKDKKDIRDITSRVFSSSFSEY